MLTGKASQPSNDNAAPRWRTLTSEAARIGMNGRDGAPSTRAMRQWCRRHCIAIRGDGWHSFVDGDAVDRAIAGMPLRHALPVHDGPTAALLDAGFASLGRGR